MSQEYAFLPSKGNRLRAHSVLFEAERSALAGYCGVSGMDPSRVSATSVGVVAGYYRNNSLQVKTFTQSYITAIPAASTGKHRYDLVVMDCTNDTLTRVAGTEATPTHSTDFLENLTPEPPDLPNKKCYLIAIICVDQNGVQSGNHGDTTTYATAGVADCRIISSVPHVQGTDQYLDYGGSNQSAVADVKDAISKKHAQLHAASHVTGAGDIIANAISGGNAGLMSGSDKAKLDGLPAVYPIEIPFDGGGVAILAGAFIDIEIIRNCTISEWTMLGGPAGTIQISIYKCSYAQYDYGSTHPVVGDSIVASDPPKITGTATKGQGTALTGWSKSLSVGDILRFYIDSCTTIQKATLSLRLTTP